MFLVQELFKVKHQKNMITGRGLLDAKIINFRDPTHFVSAYVYF